DYSHCINSRYLKKVSQNGGINPASLSLAYQVYDQDRIYLDSVSDELGQTLASFTLGLNAFDNEYHLQQMKQYYGPGANEYKTLSVTVEDNPDPDNLGKQKHPYVNSIVATTGATVNLTYQMIDVPMAIVTDGPCTPQSCEVDEHRKPDKFKRLKTVSHSGTTYHYDYSWTEVSKPFDLLADVKYIHDGVQAQSSVYKPSMAYLKVVLSSDVGSTGTEAFSRETYYADYFETSVSPTAVSILGKWIGKPIFRTTTYQNPDVNQSTYGVYRSTSLVEEWYWDSIGTANSYSAPFGGNAKTGYMRQGLVLRAHASNIDNKTMVTNYEYDWGTARTEPVRSIRYIANASVQDKAIREFSYINRLFSQNLAPAQQYHQFALTQQAKSCFVPASEAQSFTCDGATAQWLGAQQMGYTVYPELGNNQLLSDKWIARDGDGQSPSGSSKSLHRRLDYHLSGSDKGNLKSRTSGSYVTQYQDYHRGAPQTVISPDLSISSKSSQYIWEYTVVQNANNITSTAISDFIGRTSFSQMGSDAPVTTAYPSDTLTEVTRSGILQSATVTDVWGRQLSQRNAVDGAITGLTTQHYSPLGIAQHTINTQNGKVQQFVDVLGRPTHILYFEEANNAASVYKEEFFTYGHNGNGLTKDYAYSVTKNSATTVASSIRRLAKKDLLGRFVSAFSCDENTLDCVGPSVGVDYYSAAVGAENGFPAFSRVIRPRMSLRNA
ncbi:MAG: hypothetical protein HRT35_37590, partial [Algicola sp.]|nr:hypothetical protein [Algicola sp.]